MCKYNVFICNNQTKMKNNQNKPDRSELIKFWKEILKDSNTSKYSMTKFASLVGLLSYVVLVIVGVFVMINKSEIDHILIIQTIGLILTLMGFKNNFGFSTNKNNGGSRYNDEDDNYHPRRNSNDDLISEDESQNNENRPNKQSVEPKPKTQKPLDEIG